MTMEYSEPVNFSENRLTDDLNSFGYEDVRGTPTSLSVHGCVKVPKTPELQDELKGKLHVSWKPTPSIKSLPGSIDDEFDDNGILTTVDLSMINNAYANALEALLAKSKDAEVAVTEDNCLQVSHNEYMYTFIFIFREE